MGAGIYGIQYRGKVVYVGRSFDLSRRFGQHRCTLRNGNHRNFILQRIDGKHPDSLTFVVLEAVADQDELGTKEQGWIDRLRPAANLASANGSHRHTEEAKAKMRAHERTEQHRRRLSAALKGTVPRNKGVVGVFRHTDEAKAKIAEASRGRAIPFEVRSRGQKGKVFSPDHREKLRQAKLGRPNEAVRAALTGRKQPPEVVAKRVASTKATISRRGVA